MNKAAYFVSFVCGAVFGAAVMAYFKDKKKDQDTMDDLETDEFDEVVEEDSQPETSVEIPVATAVATVNEIITKNKYSVGDHTSSDDDGPYVIAADEFGEFEDYRPISMTYLSDGVLVDDKMEVVEDLEETVGTNFKNYFGVYPYDPDTVYIRNDSLCCDFEIVKDLRTLKDIEAGRPHMKWRDNE